MSDADTESNERLLKAAVTLTADELRETMRSLGMSQTRLAQELGVQPNTVHRWCAGWMLVPQYAVAYLCSQLQLREARERVAVLERELAARRGNRSQRSIT